MRLTDRRPLALLLVELSRRIISPNNSISVNGLSAILAFDRCGASQYCTIQVPAL